MNENEQNQHRQGEPEHNEVQASRKPRWRQIHHSPIFWLFVLLMLGGITYYIVTLNFALAPRVELIQPLHH